MNKIAEINSDETLIEFLDTLQKEFSNEGIQQAVNCIILCYYDDTQFDFEIKGGLDKTITVNDKMTSIVLHFVITNEKIETLTFVWKTTSNHTVKIIKEENVISVFIGNDNSNYFYKKIEKILFNE